MRIRLLSDDESNVQVDLASGKVSKKGERKCLLPQTGMTCTLFALRRIAILNTDSKHKAHLQAYKKIKQALACSGGNLGQLVPLMSGILTDNGVDVKQAILKNETFADRCFRYRKTNNILSSDITIFQGMDSLFQWTVLYEIFMEKILIPLFNVQSSGWHPRDGFNSLKECLREKGALFFMGKFGSWCYSKPPQELKSETTTNRQVFYFNKDFYQGDTKPFTHGIIVDQVKVINGREMIFYRDPSHLSNPKAPEKIYILSYETFVKRLCDLQGQSFDRGGCSTNTKFGLASACPEVLYRPI
jgi:hypothetical protein